LKGGDTIDKPMTEEGVKLLNYLKELMWGEVTVEVKNGRPVMIRHPVKEVKLTD
jgi:hypothetical protein